MTNAVRRKGNECLLDIEISVPIFETTESNKPIHINHVSLYRFLLSRPPSLDCEIVEDGFWRYKCHFPGLKGRQKPGLVLEILGFWRFAKLLQGAKASSNVRPPRGGQFFRRGVISGFDVRP